MFLFLCPGPGLESLIIMGLVFIGLPIFVIYLVVKALVRNSNPPYKLP